MIKSILCFLLLFVGFSLCAQIYVDGKDIKSVSNSHYIIIHTVIIPRELADAIVVDYGSEDYKSRDDNYLTDSKGKMMTFKTIVGALNYFEDFGWIYEDFMPDKGFSEMGGRFLLKRKE
ncbi:MAG: hypothetical protein GC192_18920 [Bacteroidetes bacterium]|nr:hypothetical protein [Bacteroidota bacterium]